MGHTASVEEHFINDRGDGRRRMITPKVTARAGVTNLTNEQPSYPSISYGDIIGRRFFVGMNAHF